MRYPPRNTPINVSTGAALNAIVQELQNENTKKGREKQGKQMGGGKGFYDDFKILWQVLVIEIS